MIVAVLALLLAASPAGLEGLWVTEDRKAIVAIGRCGRSLCGRISRILVAGKVPTDLNNPDPRLRGRPFQDLQILSGFTMKAGNWQGGRIYDPNTGKTYRSKLALNSDGSLKVSGCIAFICQSQRWVRPR